MIYVVISAAVAFILNIPFYSAVESIVKDVSEGKVYFKREVNQLMDDFQTYVNNNGISADDGDDIAKWNGDNWFVSMKIYKGNKVFMIHCTILMKYLIRVRKMSFIAVPWLETMRYNFLILKLI